MEYLLLASVTLLMACCLAALILTPPIEIRDRRAAPAGVGPDVRRAGHPRPATATRARDGCPAASSRAPDVSPSVAPSAHERYLTVPRGSSAGDDIQPYSPEELRNLLQRRPPTVFQQR
jgi:hypothetical protein